jgi:hypothetical protein
MPNMQFFYKRIPSPLVGEGIPSREREFFDDQ